MTVTDFGELWREITAAQPDPPRWLVLGAATAAGAVVAYRPAWRLARNAVTIAHEGGHALAALCTGRRLSGIRLHADTSGVTISYGKPTGFGMVLTALAGYVAPSLLGLGGAALLEFGHITALLWASVVLLALMLLMIRNFFGLLTMLVTGAVVFVATWYADARIQAGFAYLAVWFLLFGGVRPIIELQAQRHSGRAGNSDADQLATLTRLPGLFWVFVFSVIGLGAVALGIYWLVPTAAGHLAGHT